MAFRTKKISQMDPKGSNLASTDLLEISELVSGSYVTKSITGAEIIASVPPTTVNWGAIGGTLSAQTDLQNALDAKVPTSRTLTINGTTQDLSANRTFNISTGITIGTTAITSGTVGRVLFEGAGNVVQESANLFWDNVNGRLGIGTSSPLVKLVTVGANVINPINANGGNHTMQIIDTTAMAIGIGGAIGLGGVFDAIGTQTIFAQISGIKENATNSNFSSALTLSTRVTGANILERMRIASTGNVLINTTTDAGFKLDVNGTARIVNSAYFATTSGSVGIGVTNPQDKLDINGSLRIRANTATFTAVNDSSVIDYVPSTIFTTEAAMRFVSLGTGTVGGGIRFFTRNLTTDPDERMRITAGGNILINTTTDAGFKLDVNGTARVSGTANIVGGLGVNQIPASGTAHFNLSSFCYISTPTFFRVVNGTTDQPFFNIQTASTNSVTIGGASSNASAILDVISTTKGFLPPRLTTTQKNAIATPATGLMVYDTTLNLISVYNGTTWISL